MTRSFRSRETERLYAGERSRRYFGIETVARRKLRMLDSATRLDELAAFPGNRLEALHSIPVNDQWRICFEWVNGHAERVEIVDYH